MSSSGYAPLQELCSTPVTKKGVVQHSMHGPIKAEQLEVMLVNFVDHAMAPCDFNYTITYIIFVINNFLFVSIQSVSMQCTMRNVKLKEQRQLYIHICSVADMVWTGSIQGTLPVLETGQLAVMVS